MRNILSAALNRDGEHIMVHTAGPGIDIILQFTIAEAVDLVDMIASELAAVEPAEDADRPAS